MPGSMCSTAGELGTKTERHIARRLICYSPAASALPVPVPTALEPWKDRQSQ